MTSSGVPKSVKLSGEAAVPSRQVKPIGQTVGSSGDANSMNSKDVSVVSTSPIKPIGETDPSSGLNTGVRGKVFASSGARGKAIASDDVGEVISFKVVTFGSHEVELRFRLIHFWEASNPQTKKVIGLEEVLSVAELHHLPFPRFKVKDLTIETTITPDAIPGLVRVLQNSPQLKKLTLQPTLLNGTSVGKTLDNLLDVHGLMRSDPRWRSEARVFPNFLTFGVESKDVGSFMKLILTTTKTIEKMILRFNCYLQVGQVKRLLEIVPMLGQDNNVSIVLIYKKLNQGGFVSTVLKR